MACRACCMSPIGGSCGPSGEVLTTEPGSSNTLRIQRPDPPDRAIDALMRHIGPVFAKRNKRRLVVG